MPVDRKMSRGLMVAIATVGLAFGLDGQPSWGDTVVLKNGTTYRGTVDKDNTIVFVSDNLKRTIFYNSKIQKIIPDAGFSNLERFELVQPMDVHAGVQPPVAIYIKYDPWDSKGRRAFQYVNNHGKLVEMQQAINNLSPYMTKFRGIDGFWSGQVSTSQVPRPIVVGLLSKVDQTKESERRKVARWLMQAGWYPEAKQALGDLARDFPDTRENVEESLKSVIELEARDLLVEVGIRRKALQPKEVAARLRSIPTTGLPREVLDDVRDQIRKDEEQVNLDRIQADLLRDLAEKLPEADRKVWKVRLAELLRGLAEVPDAARIRLEALSKAEPGVGSEAKFALAMSGWVAGVEGSGESLKLADDLWRARELVSSYLASRDGQARANLLVDFQKVEGLDIDAVARVAARTLPPLREKEEDRDKPGVIKLHRVADDENAVPTEYAVLLPPEYHPLRSYPAVVALHDGGGPKAACDWLAVEAARRGFIVVAPEYNLPGQRPGFHHNAAEHAAAELSLRDARKRYAIDSDRVFLAGQLVGAEMAWDFGLAHPDLFAGVVAISGFPSKYAYRYKAQVDKVPLYIALGEMAPAAREVVFAFVRPMIEEVQDVTYVDYLKRGLEALPEEVPAFFDWMDRRRRDPSPKSFEAVTARPGDARFFGVVVQEIAPGRSTAPEAVEPFGQNLRPATIKMRSSVQSNLINLTTNGITRLDVWVSPKLINFSKKLEVRLNEKPLYKAMPSRFDFSYLLEDLRIRGDRQQLYYFKVSTSDPNRPRGR